jgi:hypothetical protein
MDTHSPLFVPDPFQRSDTLGEIAVIAPCAFASARIIIRLSRSISCLSFVRLILTQGVYRWNDENRATVTI